MKLDVKRTKEEIEESRKKLSALVNENRKQEKKHKKLGKKMAEDLLAQSTDSLFLRYSIGEFLSVLYDSQPEEECGEQLMRWSVEQFLDTQIKRYIPIFKKIYAQLENLNATYKNPLVYGDIDNSAWIEEYEDKKIIAVTCHCACADNNTHIFILKESLSKYYSDLFHARTAWPRETIYKYGKENWPNDSCWRDIGKPSYLTYRRHGFTPGYGDSRDKGYCFSYGGFGSGVPIGNLYEIFAALRALTGIQWGIDDPLYLPKK